MSWTVDLAVRIPGKLVFLEHPRTGSTALREALRKIGGQPVGRHTFVAAHLTERTMVVVRNPYDVLVSWWLIIGEREGYKSFSAFLEGSYGRELMTRGGRLFYYLQYADCVVRYESLERDLEAVMKKLKLPSILLKRRNITANKLPYHHYYTPETISLVKTLYHQDLTELHYTFPGETSDVGA